MKDVSMTMNSRLCNKTPLRDCDAEEGKIVCQTVYESGKYITYLRVHRLFDMLCNHFSLRDSVPPEKCYRSSTNLQNHYDAHVHEK